MKFFKDSSENCYYYKDIIINKALSCIYYDEINLIFFKNGIWHNNKNAAYINYIGYKSFYLNDKIYGFQHEFNKKSWRKFVKLQVFL